MTEQRDEDEAEPEGTGDNDETAIDADVDLDDLDPEGDLDDEDLGEDDLDDEDLGDELEDLGGEPAIAPVLDGESLTYDLAAWSRESRSLLDSLLTSGDITHGWQGTTLQVRPADADAVAELIAEAEASAVPSLDIDEERIVYEVGGWSAGTQTALAQALSDADIAYEWDENGDLVVYATDEDAVEAIFDGLDDDEEEGSDDGIVVTETLSRLWEAASALAHKPGSADAIVAVADTSEEMEALALPFGFEPNVWHTLVDSAGAMRMALANDDPDSQWSDEDLKEGATELRDLLRPFI